MFPQTIVAPFELVIQTLATFVLHQAFASTTLVDHDNPKFRVNFPFTVPITACRTYFDFGWKDELFSHGLGKVGIGKHES